MSHEQMYLLPDIRWVGFKWFDVLLIEVFGQMSLFMLEGVINNIHKGLFKIWRGFMKFRLNLTHKQFCLFLPTPPCFNFFLVIK